MTTFESHSLPQHVDASGRPNLGNWLLGSSKGQGMKALRRTMKPEVFPLIGIIATACAMGVGILAHQGSNEFLQETQRKQRAQKFGQQ